MSQRLEEIVQFEKSIRKFAKKSIKSLGKTAKKARKEEGRELPVDQAREEVDEIFTLLAKQIDTAAARDFAEASARVSLEVDGQVLLEDAPLRLLLGLRKQFAKLRKTADELAKLYDEPAFAGLSERAAKLSQAADEAVRQANETEVDQREVAAPIVAFLRGE